MIDAIYYLTKNIVFTIKNIFLLRKMQEKKKKKNQQLKAFINNRLYKTLFHTYIDL